MSALSSIITAHPVTIILFEATLILTILCLLFFSLWRRSKALLKQYTSMLSVSNHLHESEQDPPSTLLIKKILEEQIEGIDKLLKSPKSKRNPESTKQLVIIKKFFEMELEVLTELESSYGDLKMVKKSLFDFLNSIQEFFISKSEEKETTKSFDMETFQQELDRGLVTHSQAIIDKIDELKMMQAESTADPEDIEKINELKAAYTTLINSNTDLMDRMKQITEENGALKAQLQAASQQEPLISEGEDEGLQDSVTDEETDQSEALALLREQLENSEKKHKKELFKLTSLNEFLTEKCKQLEESINQEYATDHHTSTEHAQYHNMSEEKRQIVNVSHYSIHHHEGENPSSGMQGSSYADSTQFKDLARESEILKNKIAKYDLMLEKNKKQTEQLKELVDTKSTMVAELKEQLAEQKSNSVKRLKEVGETYNTMIKAREKKISDLMIKVNALSEKFAAINDQTDQANAPNGLDPTEKVTQVDQADQSGVIEEPKLRSSGP